MSKEIDYKKFIQYVHKHFQEKISHEKVQELLSLEENYNKDSPASVGKSLLLKRLVFNGEKIGGEKIEFDRAFDTGLNIWIADNGKGKSTIFKIIKYALTGDNSIKKDIRNWIEEILLEFQIGKAIYTIHINKSARVSEGGLYSLSLQELKDSQSIETLEKKKQFSFKGDEAFGNQIQTFFFNQFSYYSLKYTQKGWKRDDLSLKTAALSWTTYFKTIFLESSDHGNLFFKEEKIGDQGRKIFEMILGLRLTYPINMLTLRLNLQEEEIGKIKLIANTEEKSKKIDAETLKKDLTQIEDGLKKLNLLNDSDFDTEPLISEQLRLQNVINEKLEAYQKVSQRYNKACSSRDKKAQENSEFKRDLKVVETEINRLSKQQINMNLYEDAGSFFTNLDIKSCPHCETSISSERIIAETQHHNCSLCGTVATVQKIDSEELKLKIDKIDEEMQSYIKKKETLMEKIGSGESELTQLNIIVDSLVTEYKQVPAFNVEQKRLKEIETSLQNSRADLIEFKQLNAQKDALKDKRAIINYRLNELSTSEPEKTGEKLEVRVLNKEILIYAIDGLKRKRQELNKELLDKLVGLILKEIHEFGLNNISDVSINENYHLTFIQNQTPITFDDLTESEKLRVKFAFYLSVIQLDIEFQLGRHSRFLIFDSPGSEEISKANLDGLSNIFKEVNKRFANDLQIFLGTSLREFTEATELNKLTIKLPEETLF